MKEKTNAEIIADARRHAGYADVPGGILQELADRLEKAEAEIRFQDDHLMEFAKDRESLRAKVREMREAQESDIPMDEDAREYVVNLQRLEAEVDEMITNKENGK